MHGWSTPEKSADIFICQHNYVTIKLLSADSDFMQMICISNDGNSLVTNEVLCPAMDCFLVVMCIEEEAVLCSTVVWQSVVERIERGGQRKGGGN